MIERDWRLSLSVGRKRSLEKVSGTSIILPSRVDKVGTARVYTPRRSGSPCPSPCREPALQLRAHSAQANADALKRSWMSRGWKPRKATVSPVRQIEVAACCAGRSGSVNPGSARCTTMPVCVQSFAHLRFPIVCLSTFAARSFRRKVPLSPRGSYGRSQQEGPVLCSPG